MYFILVVLIIVVLFYYWDIIRSMFDFLYSNYNTPAFSIVNPWFLSLLILNIIILIFQLVFYYSKKGETGDKGIMGKQGFSGVDGTPCTVSCW